MPWEHNTYTIYIHQPPCKLTANVAKYLATHAHTYGGSPLLRSACNFSSVVCCTIYNIRVHAVHVFRPSGVGMWSQMYWVATLCCLCVMYDIPYNIKCKCIFVTLPGRGGSPTSQSSCNFQYSVICCIPHNIRASACTIPRGVGMWSQTYWVAIRTRQICFQYNIMCHI